MNDPQPAGYISLKGAFELYNETWPEPAGLADKQKLTDDHLAQFKYALAHDQLRASVRFPDRAGEYDIPPELWDVDGFPELEILHEDVPSHSPKPWSAYVGRTLFIREAGFRLWLEHNGWQPPPDPRDFDDPAAVATWTVPMTCAWIGTRNIETVRWQMSPWRRAHGWPDASLALLAVGQTIDRDDDEDDPSYFDSMRAFKELVHAGESASITGLAISSATGQPATLQPSDWTYGKLEFDNELGERLRVGGILYSNLTFRRVDLQRVWPTDEAPSSRTPVLTGAPGRPSSMHLVEAEFFRRASLTPRQIESSLRRQATALREWFVSAHGAAPPPSIKTIENRLRDRYRSIPRN